MLERLAERIIGRDPTVWRDVAQYVHFLQNWPKPSAYEPRYPFGAVLGVYSWPCPVTARPVYWGIGDLEARQDAYDADVARLGRTLARKKLPKKMRAIVQWLYEQELLGQRATFTPLGFGPPDEEGIPDPDLAFTVQDDEHRAAIQNFFNMLERALVARDGTDRNGYNRTRGGGYRLRVPGVPKAAKVPFVADPTVPQHAAVAARVERGCPELVAARAGAAKLAGADDVERAWAKGFNCPLMFREYRDARNAAKATTDPAEAKRLRDRAADICYADNGFRHADRAQKKRHGTSGERLPMPADFGIAPPKEYFTKEAEGNIGPRKFPASCISMAGTVLAA